MRAKKKSRKYRKKSRNLSEGPIYLSRHSFLSRASLAVLERPSTTWLTSNKKTRQPPWENTSRFVRIDREETETSSCYQLRKQTCACVRRHAARVDRCLITPEISSNVPKNRNLRHVRDEVRVVCLSSIASAIPTSETIYSRAIARCGTTPDTSRNCLL